MKLVATRTVLLGLSVLASGCFLFGAPGSDLDGDSGDPEVEEEVAEALRECRGDATDVEIADTITISDEYSDSLHEMVACGQLNVALCGGVVNGIIDAIVAQSNDATPEGWSYADEGTYRTASADVSMDTHFYLAEDFEFGKAGDLVVENLFLVDSYLVNALLAIDYQSGEVEIRFDEPGPLVELLGLGPNPSNPLPVTLDDVNSLKSKLRALEFESDITVDDPRDNATIQYHLVTPRMPAGNLLEGFPMSYALDGADGFRDDLSQQLVVESWSVDFVDEGGGALDGAIDYRVDGNHFPYRGTMVFDRSKYPESTVDCQ